MGGFGGATAPPSYEGRFEQKIKGVPRNTLVSKEIIKDPNCIKVPSDQRRVSSREKKGMVPKKNNVGMEPPVFMEKFSKLLGRGKNLVPKKMIFLLRKLN